MVHNVLLNGDKKYSGINGSILIQWRGNLTGINGLLAPPSTLKQQLRWPLTM